MGASQDHGDHFLLGGAFAAEMRLCNGFEEVVVIAAGSPGHASRIQNETSLSEASRLGH